MVCCRGERPQGSRRQVRSHHNPRFSSAPSWESWSCYQSGSPENQQTTGRHVRGGVSWDSPDFGGPVPDLPSAPCRPGKLEPETRGGGRDRRPSSNRKQSLPSSTPGSCQVLSRAVMPHTAEHSSPVSCRTTFSHTPGNTALPAIWAPKAQSSAHSTGTTRELRQ